MKTAPLRLETLEEVEACDAWESWDACREALLAVVATETASSVSAASLEESKEGRQSLLRKEGIEVVLRWEVRVNLDMTLENPLFSCVGMGTGSVSGVVILFGLVGNSLVPKSPALTRAHRKPYVPSHHRGIFAFPTLALNI